MHYICSLPCIEIESLFYNEPYFQAILKCFKYSGSESPWVKSNYEPLYCEVWGLFEAVRC